MFDKYWFGICYQFQKNLQKYNTFEMGISGFFFQKYSLR